MLSGAGLAAGVTVGALLAQDVLGSTGLAGLPSAVGTAGTALAAFAVGRLSQARGRRPGLTAGYLAGAIGSAGVITAAVLGDAVLLFASLFVYGAGAATTLQARYAGADLAAPAHRARAVSTVLVATTLGGVVGPTLAAPTGDLAAALGLPRLVGSFLLAGVAYAVATLVLTAWLRPDPLLLARTFDQPDDRPPPEVGRHRPGARVGVLVMVLTQLVMVAIMTMTPVHLHGHGHGAAASGLVIAVHVGAMYLSSPLSGRLVDRHGGRRRVRPDPVGRGARRGPRAHRLRRLVRGGPGPAGHRLEPRPGRGHRDHHRRGAAGHPRQEPGPGRRRRRRRRLGRRRRPDLGPGRQRRRLPRPGPGRRCPGAGGRARGRRRARSVSPAVRRPPPRRRVAGCAGW
ncbi:MFS transporter [Actinosynnema sp. NPDC002837]